MQSLYLNSLSVSEYAYDFPRGIQLDRFLNLSNVNFCINIDSTLLHSCSRYCNIPRDLSRDCGCDAQCYLYNDCCPDYEICCGDPVWLPQYQYPINQSDYFNYMDMLRDTIPETVGNRSIHINSFETCHTPSLIPDGSYYMITKCPDDATTDEHQLCVNETLGGIHSLIPVYVNSSKGSYYYANKFCAACHGHVDESLLQFFSPSCEWICNLDDSPYVENADMSFESCQDPFSCYSFTDWLFDPMPRVCDPSVVINCPLIENDPISEACHSYSAKVYHGDFPNVAIYKNVHCAVCNGVNVNETWNRCRRYFTSGGNNKSPHGIFGTIPLTVLFDFTSGTLQQGPAFGGPLDPLDCPEYFIYSRELHECRRIGCPSGALMIRQHGMCVYIKDPSGVDDRTLSTDFDPLYRKIVLDLAASNNSNFTDGQILNLFSDTLWRFEQVDHYQVEVYNRNATSEDRIDLTWDGKTWRRVDDHVPEEECLRDYPTRVKLTLEGTAYSYYGIDSFIDDFLYWLGNRPSCSPEFDLNVLLVGVSITNVPHVGQLCNNSAHLMDKAYGERSFERISNRTHEIIRMEFADGVIETYEPDQVPQWVTFTGGSEYFDQQGYQSVNWSRGERVYFCEGKPLCPLITLSKQDYRWQFDSDGDNVSLLLIRSNRVVPDNEIVLTVDGLVQICLGEDNYDDDVIYSYSTGQTLATTIGCTISLTLLGLVIITYCSFSSLRNVPGKTVLSLSFSLFIAQLLLLTGAGQTANPTVCLIIACFMHYFWLSVFSWTNILAFDLGRTFGKKAGMRDDTDGSLFIKYSIYGWGMPLLVVGATLIIHFFQEVDSMIRNIYGVSSACWLRTGLPILIAFGVPVAIALLANMVFFTRTVHGIRSTMKAAKILKENQKGTDDLEFLKKELYLYVRVSIMILVIIITKG